MNTSSLARMQERLNQLWGPRQRLPGDEIYLLPSDRCEWERLHFEHYALKVAFGRAFFAPLLQPKSILDVGCGPGFWAVEMCHTFPHAQVVGFDIEAPLPLNSPRNYYRVQGSLLQPLPFADGSFEYVHQRLMWAAIPARFWRSVVAELVRVTAPGGYIELVEVVPGIASMGPASAQMANWGMETERRRKINLYLMLDLANLLELAGAKIGFQRVIWSPVGARHGQIGRLMEQCVSSFFVSLAPTAHELLSLPLEQYQRGWQFMREEWQQRHVYCPFAVTLAQKTSPLYPPIEVHSSLPSELLHCR